MSYENPTVEEFKTYFSRDFPYGVDPNVAVTDADIAKAFGQANAGINPALYGSQANYTIGYMHLAAHWLVYDLQASSQGINGSANWLEQSKSVGSVSQSFAIPQRILDDPYWALLTTTKYGMKYLGLLLPQLTGQTFVVYGSTRP